MTDLTRYVGGGGRGRRGNEGFGPKSDGEEKLTAKLAESGKAGEGEGQIRDREE